MKKQLPILLIIIGVLLLSFGGYKYINNSDDNKKDNEIKEEPGKEDEKPGTENEKPGSENEKPEVNSVWNGYYESTSNPGVDIRIYTKDNVLFSFDASLVVDDVFNSIGYYDYELLVDENTLEYNDTSSDETNSIKVIKNGNEITITASSTDPESLLNKINGTYVKYKDISDDDLSDFENEDK